MANPSTSQAHLAPARFLDPLVLARIDNLALIARTVVDGFISGMHRSPMRGLSMDFAEHRAYQPGDDLRRIDWRLFGRSDRLYIKQTEADTNANISVVLDVSASMSYSSGSLSKFDYARMAAASLAYLSQRQRDRVGMALLGDGLQNYIPPAAKHYDTVLRTLAITQPKGSGALVKPLEQLGKTLGRRGIIVLLSDLYEEPEALINTLAELRLRGHDVIVCHILDPAEHTLPFAEATALEDLETGERMPLIPMELRPDYQRLVAEHCAELKRRCGEQRIDYAFFESSQPLDHVLFHYLSERARLQQVR